MRIGIDIGGTFTDFVFFDPAGGVLGSFKRLSTPDDPARAVLDGLNEPALRAAGSAAAIVHGSTVATNALLERRGARTALVTTAGFADLLTIGRQNRSALYDFFADRPEPLVPPERCFAVAERIGSHGEVVQPLDPAALPGLIEALRAAEVQAVAVCLLFAFANPTHEQQIGAALRAAGEGWQLSLASEILPEFREVERAGTTAINAYVTPALDRYLGRLAAALPDTELRIMQSNGGSISVAQARREGVRSILSGPAGGVVGAFYSAQQAGFARILTFDMGGTSTDAGLCDRGIAVTSEGEIGGLPVRVPLIDIHTVGAGGGSLARVDAGGALRVGPQSAGADPGPACYGRGGVEATVTDANLTLGRLPADYFLDGQMPLDVAAAEAALSRLAAAAHLPAQGALSAAQVAARGVIAIANAHMARALRVMSLERGHDPADFALLSFGGAGGLHACDLARALGVRTVLVPPRASTLSAFGMLVADVVKDYGQTVMLPGATPVAALHSRLSPLLARARADLLAEGVAPAQMHFTPQLDVRYRGQAYELTIPLSEDFAAAFHAAHQRAYGGHRPEAALEIVALRLRAVGATPPPPLPCAEPVDDADPAAAMLDRRVVTLDAGPAEVTLYAGARLRAGARLTGPALVVYADTTVLLHPTDRAEVDRYFNLVIRVGDQVKRQRGVVG